MKEEMEKDKKKVEKDKKMVENDKGEKEANTRRKACNNDPECAERLSPPFIRMSHKIPRHISQEHELGLYRGGLGVNELNLP